MPQLADMIPPLWTVEDFLEWAETRQERWEYYQGNIWMMSAATPHHARIEGNVFFALESQLRGGPCRTFGASGGVTTDDSVLQPDVKVSCAEETVNALRSPVLVAEVVSPSSADFDHGRKLKIYKTIPSLMHYLIVEQDCPFATLRSRVGDEWRTTEHDASTPAIELSALGIAIDLHELYNGVSF